MERLTLAIFSAGRGFGAEPADTLVFNWPHPPEKRQPWAPQERAHIEMYRGARPNKVHLPAGWCHQFQLGAISYLEDVCPQGGGTHLLPRSHEAIHRYFCSRPDDVRTGGHVGTIIDAVRDNPSATLSPARLDAVCPGGFRAPPPLELCMKAGSVCFWHHWMNHDSSYNASNNPRQAVFSRWHNVREGPPVTHQRPTTVMLHTSHCFLHDMYQYLFTDAMAFLLTSLIVASYRPADNRRGRPRQPSP